MKSRNFGFWTPEKLQELWDLMTEEPRSKTNKQVAIHFQKPRQVIFIIYAALRKQRAFTPVTRIDENGHKITTYQAGYAIGTTPMKSAKTTRNNAG